MFGQYDHRRIYGRDYAERVRECGFEVEEIEYEKRLSEEEIKQYSTGKERLYIVKRKTESGTDDKPRAEGACTLCRGAKEEKPAQQG